MCEIKVNIFNCHKYQCMQSRYRTKKGERLMHLLHCKVTYLRISSSRSVMVFGRICYYCCWN